MARILSDVEMEQPGFTVTARHPSGLDRPFLELTINWLERDDLAGAFSVEIGAEHRLYDFRFTDARTALAFKMRWGKCYADVRGRTLSTRHAGAGELAQRYHRVRLCDTVGESRVARGDGGMV